MLVEVKVPVLAESVADATVMEWHKQPGQAVQRGDRLIDLETDKVTLEVAAPEAGVLSEIRKQSGESAVSNEVLAVIDTSATATAAAPAATAAKVGSSPPPATAPKLSPAVRKIAAEQGLNPADVPAAKEGRVTKAEVVEYMKKTTASPAASPARTETVASPTPVAAAARSEQRVPMTRLRKRAAERLLAAQQENAILTTFNEVNMQPVMGLREKYRDTFKKSHGVKLGFMSLFAKAAVEALRKFPIVNASVDGDDILYHNYFDLGIAVSAPRGLVVPIVRDADQLTLAEIEKQIRELSEKARNNTLAIEDLTGGTFTITNGGVFGSLVSTPILNPPQSAILGMHKIQDRPVAENGAVVIRPMMYLALSYDHRIVDGRDAVQFLVHIKETLEDPARILLQI